jgi:DNA-binding beta-propeller fold protein YncE
MACGHKKRNINCISFLFIIAALIIIFFSESGCKKSGPVEPPDPPQLLPDDLALFASIDGNWCGIKVFEANNMNVVDSLETTPGVPFCIEFSPDYSKWYTIWHDNNFNYVLFTIDAKTKAIIRSINVTGWISHRHGWYLHLLRNKNLLLTIAGKLRFWDADNLNLIKEDSLDIILRLTNSPDEKKLYVLYKPVGQHGLEGIYVYNLETYKIENKIILTRDSLKRRSMEAADFAISPDGKYLFVTVFNWVSGGGYGTFVVFDKIRNNFLIG